MSCGESSTKRAASSNVKNIIYVIIEVMLCTRKHIAKGAPESKIHSSWAPFVSLGV